jgi:hypothetical protein
VRREGRGRGLSHTGTSFLPLRALAILYILVENNEEIRIATASKCQRQLPMYNADGERAEENQGAVLLNDPLKTPQPKIRADERVHFEGLPTPPPSSQRPSSTPIVGSAPQFSPYSYRPPLRSSSRMSSAEQPRSAESSLAPKPFAGATTETDNAERWLLYLKKYIDYRHLRDDEALALFKLLLVDQAQDWLYALPEGQAGSFERLEEAFMQRFTPNPLQRYQKASHMWTRNQGPTESVDAYITALKTAANQIQFRDEQQLGYCIIRGLRAPLANARPAEPTRDAGGDSPQRKGCRNRDGRVHGQRQDGRRALTHRQRPRRQADRQGHRRRNATRRHRRCSRNGRSRQRPAATATTVPVELQSSGRCAGPTATSTTATTLPGQRRTKPVTSMW